MGEDLKKLSLDAAKLKGIMLSGKNIDILLYLAKYNPKVTEEEIADKFGKKSLEGLKQLIDYDLVQEEKENLSLTNQGIFQVEGLLTLTA
ncbi:MAG: hypothetical protein CL944_00365 [Candidatus Diapherotrites archaeon]|uniref:ArnR1-like winged helix-turn-helix domain-containing protein n=1 Tax=Candidatus Iainarchaeum sp. TaxID=3101447 RepID=A0A2D6LP99_9ARCH|nr:hypothetical protein [Candidatus Diapherotrites archaeon]|tara:strand:+ start:15019 stop:15288 length:270 start_codon:yes stop_codon:yes gene_type:complete